MHARIIAIGLSMILTACAGQPTEAVPTVVRAVPAGTHEMPAATGDQTEAARVAEAKRLGYTLVNQDGEELFCHSVLKTGSHVQQEMVCLSRRDMDQLRSQSQLGLSNSQRQAPPPAGH